MTTYNSPHHLSLAMAAMANQSEQNFELHIADDGSTADTKALVEAFAKTVTFPVIYSWQEDKGYRKTKILNEAIRKAKAPYLIFVDGDCICHKDFIAHHLQEQETGCYLAGRRVDLGPKYSAQLTPEMVRAGVFDHLNLGLLKSCLEKDSEYFHRSIAVPSAFLRRLFGMTHVDDMKGCNFSVAKSVVEAINGFDEDYEGYAREDTDLENRMQYAGLKIKSMKGLAIQFHVWHARLSESENNKVKLKEVNTSRVARCQNGLVKLENNQL